MADAADPWAAYDDATQAAPAPAPQAAADPWAAYDDASAPATPAPATSVPTAAQSPSAASPAAPVPDNDLPPPPPLAGGLGGTAKDDAEQGFGNAVKQWLGNQGLGFGEEAANRVSQLSDRIEKDPNVKGVFDAIGNIPVVGGITDAARGLLTGPLKQQLIPWLKSKEGEYQPGAVGKGAADIALGVGAAAAAPEELGLLGGGALAGALLSDTKPGDYAGLARDAAVSGVTNLGVGKALEAATPAVSNWLVRKFATDKIDPNELGKALYEAKDKAYTAFKNMNIGEYAPHALDDLEINLNNMLAQHEANPTRDKYALDKISGMMSDLDTNDASFQNVDKWRSWMQQNVANMEGGMGALGSKTAKVLQDFLDNTDASHLDLPPGATPADVGQVQDALTQAKQANRAYRNVDQVATAMQGAENRAARTYNGLNIDNRARQSLGPLIDESSPRNMLQFLSPDEAQLMRQIVYGTPGQNIMRGLGQMSPLSGGLKAALEIGGTVGKAMTNPPEAAVDAIGMASTSAAKLISNATTRGRVTRLLDMMANGGTKESLLAAQQMRAEAAKNSEVGRWLGAAGLDLSEYGRVAAAHGAEQAVAQRYPTAPPRQRAVPPAPTAKPPGFRTNTDPTGKKAYWIYAPPR